MERALSILLVEDDPDACNDIIHYIDGLEDVFLAGVTNSSEKGMDYVKNLLPDAVILDLELHHGSGSGLLFLNALQQHKPDVRPYILVTTNNSSSITYEYARQLGADFIMAKYQADYSAQSVIEFLRMMKGVILTRSSRLASEHNTNESPEQKHKRIVRRINIELDNIGISPKAIGYQYLTDAIRLTIDKPESNLCAAIGSKYGKSDASVERAMQNAINRAWRTSDIEDLLKHYTARISSDRGVPTIMELVFYYANKIKREY